MFLQLWSTGYSKVSRCQVPWYFLLCNVTWTPRIHYLVRWCIYFNVYITGSYFIFVLFSQSVAIQNILAEAAIVKRSRKFVQSFINSLKIVKFDLKFKQKPWKINLNNFMLCSVCRTIPIIWNTFSCSSKLIPFCWTHPH